MKKEEIGDGKIVLDEGESALVFSDGGITLVNPQNATKVNNNYSLCVIIYRMIADGDKEFAKFISRKMSQYFKISNKVVNQA